MDKHRFDEDVEASRDYLEDKNGLSLQRSSTYYSKANTRVIIWLFTEDGW